MLSRGMMRAWQEARDFLAVTAVVPTGLRESESSEKSRASDGGGEEGTTGKCDASHFF